MDTVPTGGPGYGPTMTYILRFHDDLAPGDAPPCEDGVHHIGYLGRGGPGVTCSCGEVDVPAAGAPLKP